MLLKILTFSLTLVFEKALVQLKPLIALRKSSILASLSCQTSRKYGGGYIIAKLNLAYTISVDDSLGVGMSERLNQLLS